MKSNNESAKMLKLWSLLSFVIGICLSLVIENAVIGLMMGASLGFLMGIVYKRFFRMTA